MAGRREGAASQDPPHAELTDTLPASVATPSGSDSVSAVVARRDARARLRWFAIATTAFVFLGAALVWAIGGDPTAKLVLLGAIAFTIVCYLTLLWASQRPSWEAERTAELMGGGAAIPTAAALYFFGVTSAYAGMVVLGIFLYARVARRTGWALCAYVAGAAPHLALAVLIMADVIRDRGLVSSEGLSTADHALLHIALQGLYLFAFLLGRMSRKQTLMSREELARAVRVATQREALLAEARQEIALAQGVGGRGAFTDRVLGSFRLGRVIGRGGMGEVYEAEHVDDGAEAAVKVLHRHMLGEQSQVERFDREARAAFSLSSPNVVRVLQASDPSTPIPYLAMERLRGEDLAQRLRRRGRLSLDDALALGRQVARGLQAAHAAGIVHRDLKPSNLFASRNGDGETWKILDFGVAKLADTEGTLTRQGVIGTPTYMAPEQAAGRPVDHRADVYALAAIFYRALTGRPPFCGPDMLGVLYQVAGEMPVRPSAAADLPPAVDDALALGMAKEPAARFDSADELVAALAAARDDALPGELLRRAKKATARWPWSANDDGPLTVPTNRD